MASSNARSSPPNDFADLDTLEQRLLAFGRRYEQIAAPFEWKFTRHDLDRLLARTSGSRSPPRCLTRHTRYVAELPSQST